MDNTINGRTPEEIKKGLELCIGNSDLSEDYCEKCPYIPDASCRDTLEIDALAYIQQLEAAQPKWISVEERLPEPEKDVLVLYRGKYRCIGYYSEDCGLWIINDAPTYDETVTHWMPLPEPPKEVE